MKYLPIIVTLFFILLTSCMREPELHLYEPQNVDMDLPVIDLDLEVFWDYEMTFDVRYDWKAEWYYDWDEHDIETFGELGYTMPTVFNLRRYFTEDVPYVPHTQVIAPPPFSGTHYQDKFDWGFWDILVWNDINTLDGVQSLIFDEKTSLDSVVAYTNQSMHRSRFNAPRYTHAFWSPEPLFSAYDRGIEINRNLDGFVYDEDRKVWVRTLDMMMYPITYIYLTQVILHNNKGRVTQSEGNAVLSSMARSTTLNTGRAGSDAISVYYNDNLKKNMPLVPYGTALDDPSRLTAERVDIIGGRLMTFGMCNQTPRLYNDASEVTDTLNHYIEVSMLFNNGMDSTFQFNVTDQVRQRYKGGVLTVELDMDTVPIPKRSGGSGFDAVVKDFEEVDPYLIDM